MPAGPFIFAPTPQVTLSDKRVCFDHGISGHNLMKTSMLVKVQSRLGGEGSRMREKTGPVENTCITCSYPQVVGSAGHCFQNTNQGPRMQVLNLGVLGPVLGGMGLGVVSVCSPGTPTHLLTSFRHSCFQKGLPLQWYRLHPNLCVSSDTFLQGEVNIGFLFQLAQRHHVGQLGIFPTCRSSFTHSHGLCSLLCILGSSLACTCNIPFAQRQTLRLREVADLYSE